MANVCGLSQFAPTHAASRQALFVLYPSQTFTAQETAFVPASKE